MKEQGIGFNELTRRLQTSTRHTSRLLKGEANLTMGSVAELAALMKKKPRIIFE
jgi:plasmid maintenance system antidote protein VapI